MEDSKTIMAKKTKNDITKKIRDAINKARPNDLLSASSEAKNMAPVITPTSCPNPGNIVQKIVKNTFSPLLKFLSEAVSAGLLLSTVL